METLELKLGDHLSREHCREKIAKLLTDKRINRLTERYKIDWNRLGYNSTSGAIYLASEDFTTVTPYIYDYDSQDTVRWEFHFTGIETEYAIDDNEEELREVIAKAREYEREYLEEFYKICYGEED